MKTRELKTTLNVVGIAEMVLFKGNEVSVKVKKEASRDLERDLIKDAMYLLGVTVKRPVGSGQHEVKDFYRYGVLLEVKSIILEGDTYHLDVKALEKVKIEQFYKEEDIILADYIRTCSSRYGRSILS